MYAFKLRLSALLFSLCLILQPALAQEDGMAYTSGTVTDVSGSNWAYLLWQATQPTLLKDARFSIYAKTGTASSANIYLREGQIAFTVSPTEIQTHLDRGTFLGDDTVALDDAITNLFEGLLGDNSAMSLADKLSIVLQGAQVDDTLYEQMLFLARNHPSLQMTMGLGFAAPITALKTYEIRQYDPDTSEETRVLGRITLDPNAGPVILPAPGDLYQITEASGKGHLNVRLRWASPNTLRRLAPLQHGYNIYRMTRSFATSNGFDINPPTPAQMATLVQSNPSEVIRVNQVPALAGEDYTNATVTNSADDTTFFVDDNRQFWGGDPFEACSQWNYFVAARDVLGRDGYLSADLEVTICDRFPPSQPMDVTVTNDYRYVDGNGDQRLKITWTQNDETVDNKRAAAYYVYRWDASNEYLSHDNDPYYNVIAGPIAHVPGEETLSFRDDGAGAPEMPADASRTFWYTVRAVDDGDCDDCLANFSGNSAPAYGVLRDREGPEGPTGTIDIHCGSLDVYHKVDYEVSYEELGLEINRDTVVPDLRGLVQAEDDCKDNPLTITQTPAPFTPTQPGLVNLTFTVTDPSGNSATCQGQGLAEEGRGDFYLYIFEAHRQDPTIQWVEFYIDGKEKTQLLARVNFNGDDTVRYEYRLPVGTTPEFTVFCRMASSDGTISDFDSRFVNTVPAPNRAYVVQFLGRASTTVVNAEDCGGPHITVNPVLQTTNIISGTINTTPTTRQWKLYRRVDDGELSLIAVGEASHPSVINWLDDTMPSNAGRICYFAQLFDEHGNASPMVRLGCTRVTGNQGLPKPNLVELAADGDEADPKLTIRWFATTDNVERFQLWIHAAGADLADPLSDRLSIPTSPVNNQLTVELPGGAQTLDFHTYNTPRLGGPNFGAVPMFEITIPIELGAQYTVALKALNATNGAGELSNTQQFSWSPTLAQGTPAGPDVPWPARPDAPISKAGFDRVLARQLYLENGFRGVGIRVGELEIRGRNCVGGDPERPFFTPGNKAPEAHLYESTLEAGKMILPIALYRYQVPNATFPNVSGDVVQVSPLLEQVAFRYGVSPQFGTYGALIEDPFFAIQPLADDWSSPACGGIMPDLRGNYDYDDCTEGPIEVVQTPAPGTLLGVGVHQVTIRATDPLGNSTTLTTYHTVAMTPAPGPVPYEVYALDTQPVVAGASYRYLLVHFGTNREIDQVIPVDAIEVRAAQ